MEVKIACPACKQEFDVPRPLRTDPGQSFADAKYHGGGPQPGDHTVCLKCVAVLFNDPAAGWRELTDLEWLDLPVNDRNFVKKLQEAARKRAGKSVDVQQRNAQAVIAFKMFERSMERKDIYSMGDDAVKIIVMGCVRGLIEKGNFDEDDKMFAMGAAFALTCVTEAGATLEQFKAAMDRCRAALQKDLDESGATIEETPDAYKIIYAHERSL